MNPILQDAHHAMLAALEAMAKREPDAQSRLDAARAEQNRAFTLLMLQTKLTNTPTLKGTAQ